MMHCIRCIANHSHGSKLSPKEAFFFNVYNFRVSDAYVLIYWKSIETTGPNLKSRDLLKTCGGGGLVSAIIVFMDILAFSSPGRVSITFHQIVKGACDSLKV